MLLDSATWQRQRSARRKAAGICLRCPAMTGGVYTTCEKCRVKGVVASKKCQKKLLKRGACITCGQTRETNLKKCNSCREKDSLWHKAFNQTPRGQEMRIRSKKKNAWKRHTAEGIAQATAYVRKKRREDLNFRIAANLRTRLYTAILRDRDGRKVGSAVRDLGCGIKELVSYLSGKFRDGMAWDNYGDWHIDHIKPLASFDLTKREEFLEACNFKNLQPLWAEENMRKGARIIEQTLETQHA